jgi:tetratricopeptide (TPR) repeat protein
MIKKATILLCILSVCCQLAWPNNSTLEKGIEYFRAGEYWKALGMFDACIKGDSADIVAHYNKGLAYIRLNHWESAERVFQKCISIDSTKASVYQALADLLTLRADYEKAVKLYQTAIKLDPHGAAAHVSCGYALYMTGDRSAAMDNYRMALEKDSSFIEAKFRLGQVLAEDQDSVEVAERLFREVAIARPDHASVFACWSNLCEVRGEISKAVKKISMAVAIEPDNAFYHYRLAELLLRPSASRDIEKAKKEFDIANRLDPQNYPKPEIVRRSPNEPDF